MLLPEISCFKKQKLGVANITSLCIKSPFPVPSINYNTFESDVYKFINLKIVLKGLTVIKKRRLGVDPVFDVSWTIILSFWDPRLTMPIIWNGRK